MAIQKVGSELTVQNTSGGLFSDPAITNLSDGRFAVAWSDTSSGSLRDTRSQVVGSNPGTAFNVESVSTIDSYEVALAQFRSTTDIAYAWTQSELGTVRVFHSVILPTGVERVTAAQVTHANPSTYDFNPEVATHADGSYAVAFDSWVDGLTYRDINVVRYDGTGKPLSFNIPLTSINDVYSQKDSAITDLANNRTVLVWSTDSPVNTNPNTYGTDVDGTFGLRAAIFNSDGTQ
ncbi:hypothetical protein P7L87_24935, partial [Vibrio parahaemolyticus]|nr:hypothetical protein [Vibrio parahaemolyticus]